MSRFHCRTPALWLGCAFAILLLLIALVPARAVSAVGSDKAKAPSARRTASAPVSADEYVGQETCLTCHEDRRSGIEGSPHARAGDPRSPAAAYGCESCHGPGKAHVDGDGDKSKIKRPSSMAAKDVTDICLTCHERGDRAAWVGSQHEGRNLSCTTCHSVHAPKSEKSHLKKATQIETCAACHQDKNAKTRRTGHMPVREGKMECTSCHNPHGSVTNVRMLKVGDSINESCLSCHTEKRGPFLYEHAPINESCATCHDPHGSNNDRMLVAKLPMLCQRCHVVSRHPATIYDATNAKTSNRAFGRSCVQCHSQIHGSNHPSGNFFVR